MKVPPLFLLRIMIKTAAELIILLLIFVLIYGLDPVIYALIIFPIAVGATIVIFFVTRIIDFIIENIRSR